jgi:ankyrin repeat protein
MAEVNDFFAAISTGDVDSVRALLDSHPDLLAEPGPDGASAALTALYSGHAPLADELAARAGQLSVFEAAAFDDTARLAELIDADREVVESWSADGWQPLHLAAFFGRTEAARALLDADAPVIEYSRNPIAVQPLHAAAAGQHSEIVWLLIASDADVNAPQQHGWTPLHSAAHNADVESIRALRSAGADPTATNDDGKTPLDMAPTEAVRALLTDGGQ